MEYAEIQAYITSRAKIDFEPGYNSWIKRVTRYLETSLDTLNREVAKIPQLTETDMEAMLYGMMLSSTFAYYRINRIVEKKLNRLYSFASDDPDDIAFYSGSDYPTALRRLREKQIISAIDFKNGDAFLKSSTFSIQRIESERLMRAINEELQGALAEGITLQDWKNNLSGMWQRYGVSALNPWHLETVFRTNFQSIYNASSYEASQLSEAVEYLEYISVDDNRRSEVCETYDGYTYPKNDPIWATILPPNHYMCRSQAVPIMGIEMDNQGRSVSQALSQRELDLVHEDFRVASVTLEQYDRNLRNM